MKSIFRRPRSYRLSENRGGRENHGLLLGSDANNSGESRGSSPILGDFQPWEESVVNKKGKNSYENDEDREELTIPVTEMDNKSNRNGTPSLQRSEGTGSTFSWAKRYIGNRSHQGPDLLESRDDEEEQTVDERRQDNDELVSALGNYKKSIHRNRKDFKKHAEPKIFFAYSEDDSDIARLGDVPKFSTTSSPSAWRGVSPLGGGLPTPGHVARTAVELKSKFKESPGFLKKTGTALVETAMRAAAKRLEAPDFSRNHSSTRKRSLDQKTLANEELLLAQLMSKDKRRDSELFLKKNGTALVETVMRAEAKRPEAPDFSRNHSWTRKMSLDQKTLANEKLLLAKLMSEDKRRDSEFDKFVARADLLTGLFAEDEENAGQIVFLDSFRSTESPRGGKKKQHCSRSTESPQRGKKKKHYSSKKKPLPPPPPPLVQSSIKGKSLTISSQSLANHNSSKPVNTLESKRPPELCLDSPNSPCSLDRLLNGHFSEENTEPLGAYREDEDKALNSVEVDVQAPARRDPEQDSFARLLEETSLDEEDDTLELLLRGTQSTPKQNQPIAEAAQPTQGQKNEGNTKPRDSPLDHNLSKIQQKNANTRRNSAPARVLSPQSTYGYSFLDTEVELLSSLITPDVPFPTKPAPPPKKAPLPPPKPRSPSSISNMSPIPARSPRLNVAVQSPEILRTVIKPAVSPPSETATQVDSSDDSSEESSFGENVRDTYEAIGVVANFRQDKSDSRETDQSAPDMWAYLSAVVSRGMGAVQGIREDVGPYFCQNQTSPFQQKRHSFATYEEHSISIENLVSPNSPLFQSGSELDSVRCEDNQKPIKGDRSPLSEALSSLNPTIDEQISFDEEISEMATPEEPNADHSENQREQQQRDVPPCTTPTPDLVVPQFQRDTKQTKAEEKKSPRRSWIQKIAPRLRSRSKERLKKCSRPFDEELVEFQQAHKNRKNQDTTNPYVVGHPAIPPQFPPSDQNIPPAGKKHESHLPAPGGIFRRIISRRSRTQPLSPGSDPIMVLELGKRCGHSASNNSSNASNSKKNISVPNLDHDEDVICFISNTDGIPGSVKPSEKTPQCNNQSLKRHLAVDTTISSSIFEQQGSGAALMDQNQTLSPVSPDNSAVTQRRSNGALSPGSRLDLVFSGGYPKPEELTCTRPREAKFSVIATERRSADSVEGSAIYDVGTTHKHSYRRSVSRPSIDLQADEETFFTRDTYTTRDTFGTRDTYTTRETYGFTKERNYSKRSSNSSLAMSLESGGRCHLATELKDDLKMLGVLPKCDKC